MLNTDRNYTYVAKTFDAPALDRAAFTDVMLSQAMPVWNRLYLEGSIVSVQTLEKLGDIDMQTSSHPVRDWRYFVLMEMRSGAAPERVHDREVEAGLTRTQLAASGVQYLSDEVLVRPAGAGTAIPRPSPHWPAAPAHQQAAVEYIHIPESHWQEYREFMRDFMGPVGSQLVQRGYSHQISVLERTQVWHHDASLPEWNRIHILWGEFDDPRNGFFKRSSEVVRDHVGESYDMDSVLSSTNHYRLKPRMSKNVRLEALCLNSAEHT